jgi:asparagine synthase (glutamine-hydrolysing)
VDRRLAACPSEDGWNRLFYFYAKGYLGDQVLTKVDRATMAVGLEARAPLLDSRVVALACRLPRSLKLRGFQTKYLLRRAARALLPQETLLRRKQGFAMPIGAWLAGELRPLLEEELSTTRLGQDGMFAPGELSRLRDEHVAGRADHRKPLWTVLAFQRWLEEWRAIPAAIG